MLEILLQQGIVRFGNEFNDALASFVYDVATFRVDTDGRFHTYRIPLAGLSAWTGIIRGLRLDFVDDRAEPGRWVDISCISWKPCPRAPRDERRLIRSKPPFAFLDSFDSSFNGSFWTQEQGTSGTTIETNQGRLVVTVGADAPNRDIVTGIDSTCVVAGNYDIRVDYRLLEWPARSGIGLDLEIDSGTVGRVSEPMDAYFVKFLPGGTLAATGDEAGSLRLVRAGRQLTAFYKHEGRWIWLWQSDGSTGNSRVRLSVDTNGWDFPHDEVQVAFDNFSVVRGRLLCP